MKIAIIIHPLNISSFRKNFESFYFPVSLLFNNVIKMLSDYSLKRLILKVPPHCFLNTEKIFLSDSKSIQILGIMLPLFPMEMVSNKKNALNQLSRSFDIAKKKNVQIVTLAAFTSIISRGGNDLTGTGSIAYTSGNSLTAALCIEGINKALKILNKPLQECRITIIGATGDIGTICAFYFSQFAKELVMCSRNISTEHGAYLQVKENSTSLIKVETDINKSIVNADVVLAVAGSFESIFEGKNLKSGAIVCDAGMPANFGGKLKRNDVFVFEGGKASLEIYEKIKCKKWKALFPINSVFGCFAEALTLGMENNLINYSIDKGKITLNQIYEIKDMANKNGIHLADFSFQGKFYTEGEILNFIRNVR